MTHAEILEAARRVFAEEADRTPPMSLRSGEDADSYRIARPYDPADAPTQALIGQLAFWALPHLDAESWRHHLPQEEWWVPGSLFRPPKRPERGGENVPSGGRRPRERRTAGRFPRGGRHERPKGPDFSRTRPTTGRFLARALRTRARLGSRHGRPPDYPRSS